MKMMNRIKLLALVCFCLIFFSVRAEIKLPAIFGSNMVLQRNSEAALWGTARPETTVLVKTSWDKAKFHVKSDEDGKWKVKVKTPEAGGPYEIIISDGEIVKLENILIGEVWLCSGQSNMEKSLRGAANDPIFGANEAILDANKPAIRLFKVENAKSLEPQNNFMGSWQPCNRETAPVFSATAYFFGNLLQKTLGVPIGLIESDWGGTRIEAWMDEESLKEVDPNLLSDRNGKLNPNTSTALFNAMIYPMIGITMRGTIWYQGESNRKEPQTYAGLMEQMVKSWRELWGLGDFPFYYCQIAPYKYDNTVNTAYLREAQLEASKRITNSGMVSLLDVGNKDHIHPGNKRAAGERLAYFALKETYGIEGIACRGPEFQGMTIKGSSVELTFNENLTSYDQELRLFKVAGKDRTFHPAVAEIKGRKIILTSKEVPDPVAVRYAFDNYVDGNLFNLYGLPASSFRTDDW